MKNVKQTLRVLFVVMSLGTIFSCVTFRDANAKKVYKEGVFLGIEGYGDLEKVNNKSLTEFKYIFSINGRKCTFPIKNEKKSDKDSYSFEIQNYLQEGYIYTITLNNEVIENVELFDNNSDSVVMGDIISFQKDEFIEVGKEKIPLKKNTGMYKITWRAGASTVDEVEEIKEGTVKVTLDEEKKAKNIYVTFVSKTYAAPVKAVPGKRTLKNFLATAMQPIGTSLYIYGGCWDWQDVGSSVQARTIGLPQSWINFFQSQDADYTYREKDGNDDIKTPNKSYYPYGRWNQYYYAGVDCSGYVGWTVYNTLNTKNGEEGYVMSSTKMAKFFAGKEWGNWTQDYRIPVNHDESDFKVGDIFSMNGHVWICLGTCDDGSIVILHSTPSDSVTGQPGGGVQISGVGTSENCEAYQLARKYMKKYFSEWNRRYGAILRDINAYTKIKKESSAGKFSWNLKNGILSDPDHYADKKPVEILKDLFKEK